MQQEERIKLAKAIWEIAQELDPPPELISRAVTGDQRRQARDLRAIAGDISGVPGWHKWEPEDRAAVPDPEYDKDKRKRYWERRREFERGIDRCLEHTGGPWVRAIQLITKFLVQVHVEVSVLRSALRHQNHSLIRQLTAIRENVVANTGRGEGLDYRLKNIELALGTMRGDLDRHALNVNSHQLGALRRELSNHTHHIEVPGEDHVYRKTESADLSKDFLRMVQS